jgi:hypothetical protein
MRASIGLIHRGTAGYRPRGTGDFVGASFAVPDNPVTKGMGDFVGASFALPQNPVGAPVGLGRLGRYGRSNLGRVGCGPSCGCGPCSGGSSGGMGSIDLSLAGTGIGGATGVTELATVPNWIFYLAGGGLAYFALSRNSRRR